MIDITQLILYFAAMSIGAMIGIRWFTLDLEQAIRKIIIKEIKKYEEITKKPTEEEMRNQ